MINPNSLEYLADLNTNLKNYDQKSEAEKSTIRTKLKKIEDIDVNFKFIQSTKLNLVLIEIAKSKDQSVYEDSLIDLSKVILTKWQKLYAKNKNKKEDMNGKRKQVDNDVPAKKVKTGILDEGVTKQTIEGTNKDTIEAVNKESVEENDNKNRKEKSKENKVEQKELEPVRQACLNQLNKILLKNQEQGDQLKSQIQEIVELIELGLYKKHKEKVSQEYREDCRLLWSTLNKDENKDLRNKIITKQIDLKMIIDCDKKVLIDQKTQQEIQNLKKMNLDARRSDWLQEQFRQRAGKGGGIRCIRCKSTNTLTNAVQTRGADEPMTEFNTCFNCQKTWRS